jgi:two-component system CheB/CheR fusion protein
MELNNDLENIHSANRIGMLFLDENLEVRKYSPQINRIFNFVEGDVGRPFGHLNHHIVNDVDLDVLIREVRRTETILEREVKTKKGSWFLMRILPYRIAPDTYSGVVISFLDITGLKNTQTALMTSRREYALAQHTANIGSWVMNLASGECEWSDKMAALLGVPTETFGKTYEDYLDCVYPEDRQMVAAAVQASKQDKSPLEVEHRIEGPEGDIRWLSVKGVVTKGSKSGTPSLLCIVKDITERMRAEEVERRLEAVTCSLADAILVHDLEGCIKAWNPGAEHLYGWSAKESVQLKIDQLIPGSQLETYKTMIQQIAAGDVIDSFKTRRITKSGDELEVWLTAAPVVDSNGRPEAVAITERVLGP